jgi:hypothetical protein
VPVDKSIEVLDVWGTASAQRGQSWQERVD